MLSMKPGFIRFIIASGEVAAGCTLLFYFSFFYTIGIYFHNVKKGEYFMRKKRSKKLPRRCKYSGTSSKVDCVKIRTNCTNISTQAILNVYETFILFILIN